jgi:site-specific recombinase XerD
MKADDIKKIWEWFRKNGLAPSTQEKYLNHLNGLLRFCKTRVVDDMKIEGVRLPKGQHEPISCIKETDLAKIQSKASEINGWIGTVAVFIINTYPAIGLRPKELRLAQLDDLNIKKWEMLVRHPKGEKSWGEQRTVIIHPQAIEATIRYLSALNNT